MRRAGSASYKAGQEAPFCPAPRRLLLAILVGVSLGLLVSVYTVSRRNHQRTLAEATVVHETLVHKITQQEARLLDEAKLRKETERDSEKQQVKVSTLQSELESLQRQLQKAEERAEAAGKQADAASKRADATSAELAEASRLRATTQGLLADRHTPWGPSAERDAKDLQLAEVLHKIAVRDEVLVAISNKNYAGPGNMLATWMECVKRVGITNAMVVALDDETKQHVTTFGLPAVRFSMQISESQKDVGENHAVSGLKFQILRRFLDLGYAVLLSDVDIVTLQNPFAHLARDSDVESMSDGFDNATAYGYNDVLDDPAMGWARYAHSMRVFCFNSGLFYMRPTAASIDLLDKVAHRIATEKGWDQAIFNEVIFFPSHGIYQDPAVTRRVLDIYEFMNSKVLFTNVRHNPGMATHLPVMVHVNYHPDKHSRMLAIIQRYVFDKAHALDSFPNGSQ